MKLIVVESFDDNGYYPCEISGDAECGEFIFIEDYYTPSGVHIRNIFGEIVNIYHIYGEGLY